MKSTLLLLLFCNFAFATERGEVFRKMAKNLDKATSFDVFDKAMDETEDKNEKDLIRLTKDTALCCIVSDGKEDCNWGKAESYGMFADSLDRIKKACNDAGLLGRIAKCNLRKLQGEKKPCK